MCLFLFLSEFSLCLPVSLSLSHLWMDGWLWMLMYTFSWGLGFGYRLEREKGLGWSWFGERDKGGVFFLGTWVLFVLGLFDMWPPFQILHLQVISHVQFTIFSDLWLLSLSIAKLFSWMESHWCSLFSCFPHLKSPISASAHQMWSILWCEGAYDLCLFLDIS